jgi:hypothetical protein
VGSACFRWGAAVRVGGERLQLSSQLFVKRDGGGQQLAAGSVDGHGQHVAGRLG